MSECPNCRMLAAMYEERLNAMGIDLAEAERDLKGKRLRIRNLEAELAEKQRTHSRLPDATEVFEFWKAEISPKARAFKGDRRKAVLARLDEGRTVEELKQAILGCKHGSRQDEGGMRYDELELICRSDEKVLLNLKRYEAWRRREEQPKVEPEAPAKDRHATRRHSSWSPPARKYSPEPVDDFLDALTSRQCAWRPVGPDRWMAQCPAHADRGPSLSIRRGDDARVLMNCFAGCEKDDILAALGLTWADTFSGPGDGYTTR